MISALASIRVSNYKRVGIPKSDTTPIFQFSIAAMFCVTTVVAILCFLIRQEGVFPYWTIVPGICFIAACHVARSDEPPHLAWGLFTIAWLIALFDTVDCLISSFASISGHPPVSDLQYGFSLAYSSSLILPFFLSLPTIYLARKASKASQSYGRKWIIACSIVGIVDVTVLTVWLILFFGYTWPWTYITQSGM